MKNRINLFASFFVFAFFANTSLVHAVSYELDLAFSNLIFNNPVDLQNAGDGTNRLFVVEQDGIIHSFSNVKDKMSTNVFLDIQNRVNRGGSEEGLLGLAFHPQFEKNGYFFVNYTAKNPRRTVIERFEQSRENRTLVDKKGLVILEYAQPYSNHNGGGLVFGADGFLYIGTGDGGSAHDPHGNGQNRRKLLGKMLRIDVNRKNGRKLYAIPSDNPYAGNRTGYREEIFAYGLRNPWRYSFDSQTGALWAADVGQNKFEEVNILEKGKNYGWNIMEGNHCFKPASKCSEEGLVKPVGEYTHKAGQSITGGYVYRGKKTPKLVGSYIFGDFVTGRIWQLKPRNKGYSKKELLDTDLNISSFGIDEKNELYICSYYDGKIYQLKVSP